MLEDDGTEKCYTFEISYDQDLHISTDTYAPRMYPYNCKEDKIYTDISVKDVEGNVIKDSRYSDWIGFGHLFMENL